MPAIFRFFRFRFHFRALERLRFPAGKAGNTVRGALGTALAQVVSPSAFRELFAPVNAPVAELGDSPSGLADPARPFVLRVAHLDGAELAAGDRFFFDVHVFDPVHPPIEALRQAFELAGAEGIGPGRGRATLERIEQLDLQDGATAVRDAPCTPPLALDLEAIPSHPVAAVRLRFATPTELKSGGRLAGRPDFAILLGRLRDRLAGLSARYGGAAFELDFRDLGERARAVRLTRADLEWRHTARRSSRTGQVHPLAGFTGEAEYAGDLTEFVPWLTAARWVGVGRHTVWGQGEVRLVSFVETAPASE